MKGIENHLVNYSFKQEDQVTEIHNLFESISLSTNIS